MTNNTRKRPMRRCVGCNEMKAKMELIRVLKSPEADVTLDATGRQNGRGAYLCKDKDCLKKAIRSKGLERSLGISIPEEVYEKLEKEMDALE